MNKDALRPRPLAPTHFPTWVTLCDRLVETIRQGPGLVALVGIDGSGKTYTLKAVHLRLNIPGAYRLIGQDPAPDAAVDLVDNADSAAVVTLAVEPSHSVTRVLAVTPDTVQSLLRLRPDARIVIIQPMSPMDVEAMLDSRCEQFGLGREDFTPDARAMLRRMCGGNPRRVDRLFALSLREGFADDAVAVDGIHVLRAVRALDAEQSGTPEIVAAPDEPASVTDTAIASASASVASKTFSPDACTLRDEGAGPGTGSGTARPTSSWDILSQPYGQDEIARLALEAGAASRRRRVHVATATAVVGLVAVVTIGIAKDAAEPVEAGHVAWKQSAAAIVASPLPVPPYDGPLRIRPQAVRHDGRGLAEQLVEDDPVQAEVLASLADRLVAPGRGPASAPVDGDGATAAPTDVGPARGTGAAVLPPLGASDAGPLRDAAKADRLLRLGQVLARIGQQDDAEAMFRTAAALGSGKAQGLVRTIEPKQSGAIVIR